MFSSVFVDTSFVIQIISITPLLNSQIIGIVTSVNNIVYKLILFFG